MVTAPLPVIVYGYDPLCGWCFGAGPATAEVRRTLDGEVGFEVACGGLVSGERVRPVALDRDYLVAGLRTVAERTGVRSGPAYAERILGPGTWVSDSEPPCRAIRCALDLAGHDAALDLGAALCTALYVDGLAPDDPATVRRCADAVGLDGEELVRRWSAPEARAATSRWFAETRAAGVTTYPSLFLRTGGGLLPLTAGAVPADDTVRTIRAALQLA